MKKNLLNWLWYYCFESATFRKKFIYLFFRNEQQPIEFCTVALPRIAAPNVSNTQTPREHSIERLEQVKAENNYKFIPLSLTPIKPIIISFSFTLIIVFRSNNVVIRSVSPYKSTAIDCRRKSHGARRPKHR